MQGLVPPDPSGQGISQPVYATVYMPKFKGPGDLLEDTLITNDSWKPISFTVLHSHEKVLPITIAVSVPELKEGEYLQLRKQ